MYYYQQQNRRLYYSNGKRIKTDDPYAILGLQWGDGATTAEIQAAYRAKARALHPDVNPNKQPEEAHRQFQKLQQAYESLMKKVTFSGNKEDAAAVEEWRLALWRQSDRIALDRTDVAGAMKKRPAAPASTGKTYRSRSIGHPAGGVSRRADLLGKKQKSSNSVGTGRNKWVTPKKLKPWVPHENKGVKKKRAATNSRARDSATTNPKQGKS